MGWCVQKKNNTNLKKLFRASSTLKVSLFCLAHFKRYWFSLTKKFQLLSFFFFETISSFLSSKKYIQNDIMQDLAKKNHNLQTSKTVAIDLPIINTTSNFSTPRIMLLFKKKTTKVQQFWMLFNLHVTRLSSLPMYFIFFQNLFKFFLFCSRIKHTHVMSIQTLLIQQL